MIITCLTSPWMIHLHDIIHKWIAILNFSEKKVIFFSIGRYYLHLLPKSSKHYLKSKFYPPFLFTLPHTAISLFVYFYNSIKHVYLATDAMTGMMVDWVRIAKRRWARYLRDLKNLNKKENLKKFKQVEKVSNISKLFDFFLLTIFYLPVFSQIYWKTLYVNARKDYYKVVTTHLL